MQQIPPILTPMALKAPEMLGYELELYTHICPNQPEKIRTKIVWRCSKGGKRE
jgi:hypothetical protein